MQFILEENKPLTPQVYRMRLAGDTSAFLRPGQFVQIQVPGFYLRRPISVCDWDASGLTLVYKLVGEGTRVLAAMKPGEKLDLLTGLGNGFDTALCGEHPLLVGGGVGLPPLIGLCRTLRAEGKHPTVVAGFNTAAEIFLQSEVVRMDTPFLIATMDGSAGVTGLVTDAMKHLRYDSVCACGPLPMLKAVYEAADVPGQFSFEERMGCGFGACMGCSIQTKNGPKRVCKDGPVFRREEILW